MWKSVVAISIGASVGALLRWWFVTQLNSLFPTIPPGTLAANLIGGYIIGPAIAFFSSYTDLSPEWRLFTVTGFCGGLTTFSTFSRTRGLDAARAAACSVCRLQQLMSADPSS